jgi:hypothetical protein
MVKASRGKHAFDDPIVRPLVGTRIYRVWLNMLGRCSNPNLPDWHNYGGRGITICDRWRSFENFALDMHEGYGPELSIDRINVNGNYEPGNCRWATRSEQQRNQRVNRYLTYDGRTLLLVEWAEETGIRYSTLIRRADRGWPPERMLAPAPTPLSRPPLTYNGRTMTAWQWAKESGISHWTICERLDKGWPIADVLAEVDFRKERR